METTYREQIHDCGLDSLLFFRQGCARLMGAVLKSVQAVRGWNRVQRDTRALLGMSDHLLKDIGISREEVLRGGRRRDL